MDFTAKKVKFTLKDIGSEVIDQLSRDVYTGAESIIREVFKNAYDAYLEYDAAETEDDLDRSILVSRDRDDNGVGRLVITDKGVGQTIEDVKANLQISISHKREEVDNPTGFRGLGSWALLGGGSRVVITSRKKNHPSICRLNINTRKIYERMGPQTTLDDILNDTQFVTFAERTATPQDEPHFTIVEIECDGEPGKVQDYEINRLYPYTDPEDTELRELILRSCQIPFSTNSPRYQDILKLYRRAKYTPTSVVLAGERLERRIPPALSAVDTAEIFVGNRVAAVAWFAEHPTETRQVTSLIDKQTNVLGPSIQLLKYNVPIGAKGLYASKQQGRLLDWYVGEVHIVAPDVLPNADSLDLRAGAAKDAFMPALQSFYDKLVKRATDKSDKINLIDKLQKGVEAVKKLNEKDYDSGKGRIQLENIIVTAVEKLEDAKKRSGRKAISERNSNNLLDDPEVRKTWQEARKIIRDAGYLEKFGASAEKRANRKKKPFIKPNVAASENEGKSISVEEFQAKLGRAIPRFQAIGLDIQQIEEIFRIITEVLET
jgi:hypothetical protein